MFMEVLAAKPAGNEQLANFYVERFLPMYARLTMHGWRKDLLKIQMPIRIHLCQGSTNRGAREAADATAKAASTLKTARSAGNISGQYLANTVLFATVLFFAARQESSSNSACVQ